MNKKFYLGWKDLHKAKNEEIVSINFQAPAKLRKRFMYIIKSNPKTNAEIEFLRWMDRFIKKWENKNNK